MHFLRALTAIGLLFCLLLAGCGGASPSDTPATSGGSSSPQATGEVLGARNAVAYSLSVVRMVYPTVRSAPLLSVYVNLLLADGLAVPVHAALEGIDAQLKLIAPPTAENLENLYALLEEFGAVLHVDIADTLNRSDNRAETLDAYTTGLGNITERSRRRSADVAQQVTALKTRERDQKAAVARINKELQQSTKAKDYATAQDRQRALAEAQTALTQTSLQLKELNTIQSIFKELLGIADARIVAIQSNREVLIAGLKVVDLPGVTDLGVLEQKTGARRRGGGVSPFGGL